MLNSVRGILEVLCSVIVHVNDTKTRRKNVKNIRCVLSSSKCNKTRFCLEPRWGSYGCPRHLSRLEGWHPIPFPATLSASHLSTSALRPPPRNIRPTGYAFTGSTETCM